MEISNCKYCGSGCGPLHWVMGLVELNGKLEMFFGERERVILGCCLLLRKTALTIFL